MYSETSHRFALDGCSRDHLDVNGAAEAGLSAVRVQRQPPAAPSSGVSKSPSAPCSTQQQCKTMGRARTMLASRRGTIGLAGRPGEGLTLTGISGPRGSGGDEGLLKTPEGLRVHPLGTTRIVSGVRATNGGGIIVATCSEVWCDCHQGG